MAPKYQKTDKKNKQKENKEEEIEENDLNNLADNLGNITQTSLDLIAACENFFKTGGFGEVTPKVLKKSIEALYTTIVIRGREFKDLNKPYKLNKAIIKKGSGGKKQEHDFKKVFSIKFASSFIAAMALDLELKLEKPSIVWPTQLVEADEGKEWYLLFAGEPAWTWKIYRDYFKDGNDAGMPDHDWVIAGTFLLEFEALKRGKESGKLDMNQEGKGESIAMLINVAGLSMNDDLVPSIFVNKDLPTKTGSRRGGDQYFRKLKVSHYKNMKVNSEMERLMNNNDDVGSDDEDDDIMKRRKNKEKEIEKDDEEKEEGQDEDEEEKKKQRQRIKEELEDVEKKMKEQNINQNELLKSIKLERTKLNNNKLEYTKNKSNQLDALVKAGERKLSEFEGFKSNGNAILGELKEKKAALLEELNQL